MLESLQGVLGLAVFLGVAWGLSENRSAFTWRVPVVGVAAQVLLALVLLELPPARALFAAMNGLVLALQSATDAGTGFVFGYLGGLSTMVPERRDEVVALGLEALVAGTLATCCTGAVVGLL